MRIACRSAVTRHSHTEISDLGLHPALALPLIPLHAKDDVDRTARLPAH